MSLTMPLFQVNLGAEFDHLHQIAKQLKAEGVEVTFRPPRFFSDTRFANYSYKVFLSFLENFGAIVRVLAEMIEKGQATGASAREREKADKAAGLLSKILNLKFLLQLAIVCDVYKHFGACINLLQKVNELPHERFDKFEVGCIQRLSLMKVRVGSESCPCAGEVEGEEASRCSWPVLHKLVKQYRSGGNVAGVLVPDVEPDPPRPGTRQGSQQLLRRDDGGHLLIANMEAKAKEVTTYLEHNLGEVYSASDRVMIENIREVLDLEALLNQVVVTGPAATAALRTNPFLEAAEKIDPGMYERCQVRTEWREQHQQFVRRLGEIAKGRTDLDIISSMQILVLMLESGAKRYEGCELVLHIITRAATLKSVESVVESWISVLEAHSSKTRPLSEESTQNEMMISINGPLK